VHAGGKTFVRESRSTGGLYSANDPRIHFGLGQVQAIDWIEVRWPSGVTSRITAPPLDSYIVATEPMETSK
jgi:hypothetical protein